MLTLIAAIARNNAIGRDNDIPWRAPADLAAFKLETTNGIVIMGRRTWESLPRRPLPGRVNIIVTSHAIPDEETAPSIQTALEIAARHPARRIYGIGGHGIYAGLMPHAHRLLLTHVDVDVPDADTFFPTIGPEWHEISRLTLSGDGPPCHQVEYLRR